MQIYFSIDRIAVCLLLFFFVTAPLPALSKEAAARVNLSGTYKLKRGSSDGLLLLRKVDAGKYKFLLNLSWTGANPGQVEVGEESGVLNLVAGKANHKGDDFILSFDLTKADKCTVKCAPPDKFGGIRVNPDGAYNRTSRKVPPDSEFDL